jgi:hypothetical protein
VTGTVTLLNDGVEMIMPGDNTSFAAELITPIAMEKGLRLQSVRVVEQSVLVQFLILLSNSIFSNIKPCFGGAFFFTVGV